MYRKVKIYVAHAMHSIIFMYEYESKQRSETVGLNVANL